MNCVCKYFLVIKGGCLVKVCWLVSVYIYVIFDVFGDEVMVIVFGFSVGDLIIFVDVLVIFKCYVIDVLQNVFDWFVDLCLEIVKFDDLCLVCSYFQLIVMLQNVFDVVVVKCCVVGFLMLIFGDLEGEVWEVVKVYVGIVWQICKYGQLLVVFCVIFFGGEIIVIVCGNGCGGCNVEFFFSFIVEFKGELNIWVLVGDIDGIDGLEDNVGVLMMFCFYVCGEKVGLKICDEFDDNNGYGYFQVFGDLLVIGLICINVNDFCVIFIFEF